MLVRWRKIDNALVGHEHLTRDAGAEPTLTTKLFQLHQKIGMTAGKDSQTAMKRKVRQSQYATEQAGHELRKPKASQLDCKWTGFDFPHGCKIKPTT